MFNVILSLSDKLGLPRALVRPLIAFIGYGGFAYLSLAYTRFGQPIESVWVSNALLVAALVATPRGSWAGLILGAALGHWWAHSAVGDGLALSITSLVGNILESVLCASLLRLRPSALALKTRVGIAWFFAICVGSAACSSAVVALASIGLGEPLGFRDVMIWLAVDSLGFVVFLPIFHGFSEEHWRRIRERPLHLLVAVFTVVALASVGAWFYSPVPRLVLVPLFVVIAFDLGVAGVTIGLCALLLTFTIFVLAGHQPMMTPYGDDLRNYLLLVQGYMAALAGVTMPLSVVLDERARMSIQLAQAAKEEAAKIEAEKANAFKSRLIAMASHDLRQPLQALQNYIDVFDSRITDPQLRAVCSSAGHTLHSMHNILDALLDVTRLDAGIIAPQLRAFPVGEMLERMTASSAPHAEAKGLTLKLEVCPLTVYSDPNLLERVLANFLSNAIRYTKEGQVTLYCETRDRQAIIHVADTGIGIPHDAQCSIFDDYVQLNNPERDREKGLGLGLTIAKRMATLLNHNISVRSIVGRGSTFSISVPLVAEAHQVATEQFLGTNDPRGKPLPAAPNAA